MEKQLFNLTAPQKSIWLTEKYFTNSNINNICGTAIVSEILDFNILNNAINLVIKKNDIFKLHFIEENGTLKQYFQNIELHQIDLIELENESQLRDLEQKLLSRIFDINKELYEFKMFKVKNTNKSGYVLNIHHIKADAFTLGLISQKIMQEYISLSTGKSIETIEKVSYQNYIFSEKEYLTSPKFEKDKMYWKEKFSTTPNIITIPSLKNNSNDFSITANRYNHIIKKDTMQKITEFCTKSKISVFNLFMTILGIYMQRVNQINDFVIGTPILNRTNFSEKNTLGMFINVAPLRINIDENSDIKTLLSTIATDSISLLRHQKYSYQYILEDLRKQNPSIPNLYNIVLSYQITKTNIESNIPYETRWNFTGTCSNDIDIHLFDLNSTGELNIAYDYKVNKYDEIDIENINKRLLYILNQILENPEQKIKNIEIATIEEREKILKEFNNTKCEYPSNKTIIELFEEQVKLNPNNIAVVFENKKLTYRELNEKANQLSNYLIKNNLKKQIIAVYLNKSIDYIISILAILKSGNIFMPISINYPKDRVEYMIKNSETPLIISKSIYLSSIKHNLPTINLDNFTIEDSVNTEKNLSTSNDLAYIIYTSGSTGRPKAVAVSNKSLVNHIFGIQSRFNNTINNTDIALSLANISFDANIQEIFIPLVFGAKLHLLEDDYIYNSIGLAKYIYEENISFAFIPPTLLDILYEELTKYEKINLSKLLVGVQSIYNTTLNNYFKFNPNMQIHNGYGPTEATICCISQMYNDINNDSKYILPIGKPMDNCEVYILNSNGKLQPPQVTGEICISGDCLSEGYIKSPKKTKEKFIYLDSINKFIYKTGDLAYYTNNGNIKFVGRQDNQIKLHGFRIELEEINTVISKNSNVKSSYTLLYKENKISSFIVPKNNSIFDIEKLKKYLRRKLPYYMIPTNVTILPTLPPNKNGKVDRSYLIDLLDNNQNDNKEFLNSENNIDKKIESILNDLLHIDRINFNKNLFELGGDSLTAIKLSSAIKHEFSIELTVKKIFEFKSLKELSLYIEKNINNNLDLEKLLYSFNQNYYPISSAQKRIYYSSTMSNSTNGVYNICGGIEFYEKLDFNKIEKIFEILVNRHEAFRTFFEVSNGKIQQKILKNIKLNIDVKEINRNNLESEFELFNTNFDLSKAPLVKIKVLYLNNNHTMLLLNMHHIISDGTSMQILINEFCKLYNNEILPINKFTYKDFINYEKNYFGSDEFNQSKEFWLSEFADEIPTLNLSTNKVRPSVFSYRGNKISKTVNSNLSADIINICKNLKITPYLFLLATYYILLYKYTGQEDIVIGTLIANRNTFEFSNIIGMFVNTLAIRKKINSNKSFAIFLDELKEKFFNCFNYQSYPFDELIKNLNIPRDTSRNPLFDTLFIYQNNIMENINFNSIKSEYYIPNTKISKFDLSLEIIPNDAIFTINLEYCTDLFNQYFMEDFLNHYIELLNNIVLNINNKISNLGILSNDEKNKIINDFNNTKKEYNENEFLYNLIDNQCKKTPNYTAITFNNTSLTYQELLNKSNSLANHLHSLGIGRDSIVGIMLPRSLELLVAIIATLKTGACYIPIDPSFPENRIEYMLTNSNASLLLTLDNNNKTDIPTLCINFSNTTLYNNPILNFSYFNLNIDPSYIIYTSGSTGNPKGVILNHKALINLTNYLNNYVEYFKNDYGNMAIASLTTISFDIFIFETLISLQKGLNVVLSTENEQTMPNLLNDLLKNHNIKAFQLTPSRMEILLNNIELVPELKNVKFITLAGEAVSNNLLNSIKKLGNITVYNGYGPSETTIYSTFTDITNQNNVNIGKPIDNTQIYILDKDNNLCPIEVPGELCICGDGLGLGYKNVSPTLTTNFTITPTSKRPMYRTGDLAKFLPNGELQYLGRIDNQIKIRGLRIELDEIRNKILEFPNITQSVLLTQTDSNNRNYLVAYLTINSKISITKLREYLRKYLPKYMIPSYFEILDEFPYLPNGKINKKLLPLPNLQLNTQEYVPARNELDKQILHLFEDLLNISPIGINDNFFELGGDSLLAINLQIQLMQLTNEISYADIFLNPTVKELSNKINNLTNIVEAFSDTVELLNLNTNISPFTNIPTEINKKDIGNILLTGATGYLGSHILNEFLKTEKGIVYCLLRPEKGISIETKLKNKLHFYFDDSLDKYINNRIIIIKGDISLPNLGLSEDDYSILKNNITTIINCAARVSHFGKYELFKKINVDGVKNLIDFCKQNNKTLYHMSTTSISGHKTIEKSSELSSNVFKENLLFINQYIDNVYVRSKFDAEKNIISELKNGLDAYIIRLGNLMGRFSDGCFQKNVEENAYINRLLSFIRLKNIPKQFSKQELEFTPIDKCAEAVIKLINHSSNNNRIFHILNHNKINTEKLLNIFEKNFFKINVISDDDFSTLINTLIKNNNSQVYLNGLINDFDKTGLLNYENKIELNSDFSVKYLEKINFHWPDVTEEYILKFLNYLNNIYHF